MKKLILISCLVLAAAIAYKISGFRLFIIRSGSMEPELSKGDLVIASPQSGYGINDTIVYQMSNDSETVAHKIIERSTLADSETYRTQGTANSQPDSELVENSQIVGRVDRKIGKIGWVALLSTREYLLASTWLIAIIVVIAEMKDIVKTAGKLAGVEHVEASKSD